MERTVLYLLALVVSFAFLDMVALDTTIPLLYRPKPLTLSFQIEAIRVRRITLAQIAIRTTIPQFPQY
jgi:hypothetical protein